MKGLTFEAVQNLGVAVVMCLITAAFVRYMFDKFMAYLSAEQESHKAEMSEITAAVNNNTTAMSNIMTILERMADENESG